jgi:hypothetical protein
VNVLAAARKHTVFDSLYQLTQFLQRLVGSDYSSQSLSLTSISFDLTATVDSGFPSHDEGRNISIQSDLSRISVDSDLPSFCEGGSTSDAPLSSVGDFSPSELQVFISREKPETDSVLLLLTRLLCSLFLLLLSLVRK